MTAIAVLVPVLGRPANAQPLADSFAASDTKARLIFVCSPDDHAQIAACMGTFADVLVTDWPAGHADFQRKIQLGFDETDEPFVFQAADDVEFAVGWDVSALTAIESGGFGVCGTNDEANPSVKAGRHSTHSLIRRSYVEECGASWDGPGTVFSTAYSHNWCDVELVELAKLRGCWVFAAGAVVRHRHPLWGTAVRDATYEKGNTEERADRQLFEQRRRQWQVAA